MTYISFCSGIEAATAAWHTLGWSPVAFCEIDKFASRVLAHHYPNVPNLGDFTKVDWSQYSADICVGGTPCQAFSVAGLRNSLADERGNLTLEFVRAINIIRPRTVVWENVPGVLSTADNAFGCFLAALVGCDEPIVFEQGWPNSGVVDGPDRRAAWRILDAQYFGLAQRRKRVFVVANSGDRPHPAEILLEWESLRRDSAPSRTAGEGAAAYSPSSFGGYGEGGGSLRANGGDYGGGTESIVAMCLNGGGMNRIDAESETFVVGALCAEMEQGNQFAASMQYIAHSLRADGFDASEDGTGRGTPLVAVADTLEYNGISHASTQERYTRKTLRILRQEIGEEAFTQWGLGVLDPLQQAKVLQPEMLCESARSEAENRESRLDGISSQSAQKLPQWALCAMRKAESIGRSSQGQRLAKQLSRELGADLSELPHERAQAAWFMHCLWQASEGLRVLRQALSALQEARQPIGSKDQSAHSGFAVRRLTPSECEILMGFRRGFTNIPGAADGPRYRSLGNSMAVPVMAWIGRRISEAYAND